MFHFLERRDEGVEIRLRRLVEQRFELLSMCCDKLAQRWDDLVGRQFGKSRK